MKNTIIYMAIMTHLIWAGLLIYSPSPETVTGINLLYRIFPNRFLLAGILIAASTMAYIALKKAEGTKSLMLLLPQQFLLVLPAIAVFTAITAGHFADGVIRPRAFLTADKISIVLVAIFHSMSLLKFHHIDEESEPKI